MEQFDSLMKEMAEKEEIIVPEGFDGRVQAALDGLPSGQKKRKPGAVRAALIAAAACAVLMGTAFAANAVTGGLVFDALGNVVLGRFERGMLVDEHGPVDPSQADDAKLESGEYTVRHPDYVGGMLLTEENGRVILYGRSGLLDVRLDITDELLENGTFYYYGSREENYLSITVYSVAPERYAQDDPDSGWYPLVYNGVGYVAKGSGWAPNNRGGISSFEFLDARSCVANSFDLSEFIGK